MTLMGLWWIVVVAFLDLSQAHKHVKYKKLLITDYMQMKCMATQFMIKKWKQEKLWKQPTRRKTTATAGKYCNMHTTHIP